MLIWTGRMAVLAIIGMITLPRFAELAYSQDSAAEKRTFTLHDAVVLSLTESNELVITSPDAAEALPVTTPHGIVIWKSSTGRERWAVLKAGGMWPAEDGARETIHAFNAGTRGNDSRALGGVSSGAALASTIQLEPLAGTTLTRGAGFLSPQDGAEILSSRPTIRRLGENGKFPARTAIISVGNSDTVLLRIPFQQGQSQVSLAEFTDWPASLKEGLPAGAYTIKLEMGLERNRFTVLAPKQRQRYWQPISSMFDLVGQSNDSVALQFAVEHLLSFQTDDDGPRFLSDALDLLESVPSQNLTALQKRTQQSLREWLDKLATDPGYRQGRLATGAPGAATGIVAIDTARKLIASGDWTDALHELDQIEDVGEGATARRLQGLKSLYRGVIFAEAGVSQTDEAISQFGHAIELLTELKDSMQGSMDLLRAYNNYANYRLLLAQNGLSNHAFQMAAGVDQPVSNCLLNLKDAREQYNAALEVAVKLEDAPSAHAIRINLARVMALLADIVRTLDVPQGEDQRGFVAGEAAAAATADKYALEVTSGESSDVDPETLSAAWELRSQLAYRRGDWKAAVELAQRARKGFVEQGNLTGVETSERLLGLVALAESRRTIALNHFSIAQLLAELQRARFPQDHTGQARAGYFARHSFIYEKLVELYLAAGRPQEALHYAELMKARAAQDLLATLGIAEPDESLEVRSVEELLAEWPENVAAVEYYLGAERGWGFVIHSGTVRAFELSDENGMPIPSRRLLTDVRQFLSEIDGQAEKMKYRLLAGRGYDSNWQNQLYAFRKTLLPDEVMKELREVTSVVIVPQHILHYFPFAALVTDRDLKPRDIFEMVKPRFLVDETFDLICAPSLTIWDLIRRRKHSPLNQVKAIGLSNAPGARPLPGVTQDLKNLRSVFGARLKQVIEGENATEQQAATLLGEPGLLMFATHGFNDAEHPAESYLLFFGGPPALETNENPANLSSDTSNDGRLTAREIFQQRINARLIVMSACYSGLGDRSPQPGDDLFGLQRAFLHAGARAVLSGLWDVYDGTAPELILQFHERIAAGKAPTKALAESQRQFLDKLRQSDSPEPWLHPFFWSVFCISGAD